jgi:hypothetical protein
MSIPYILIEIICRGEYMRWMLFQVGVLPSLHIRKNIYKPVGVSCGNNVVFHFKTEIRNPILLTVGGAQLLVITHF